ncbi:MAG TPA: ABC-F family ATP-binding cassette domain-containing protein [Kofleriaceae bacterium]|nr:ABC-F family ATP-binding cassette domain-containing protein [Kofleriaceae bacterium]
MSLVVLDGVTLSFGARNIVDGLGLRVAEHDRIGLIGPNGSGKTTLLRLLAGEQDPDKGIVQRAARVRVGYLPQDLAIEGGRTLIDFVLSSVPGREQLDEELAATEADLTAAQQRHTDDDTMMTLAARIAEIHERIDHFERFYAEHEAHGILAGLGFSPADKDRDLGEFSGGWKMRAVLAGILFQQPDLALFDEPTNHLDMPSVAWFSDFLEAYKRSFILISHDREFLNAQIERVVSFEPEGVRSYTGNYDRYLALRAEEQVLLENKARNLAREREHMEKFVTRFRAQANKARAVQSRVKALEKMEDIEQYERHKVMRFTFPPTERTVNEVVRIEGLKKAYGDLVVFPGLDLVVRRGQKIAMIGKNGAGKTTLLKMIAGELAADAGKINLGNGVKLGYYAQHHADTLNRESTAYDEVHRANPDASIGRVRSVLGAFLFSGDDVEKPVSVLSGGERARVALARLLINPGNVLLMDEPTNHLDLTSAESLAASLSSFDGTLIFVSHSLSLIRSLATTIWNVEDGTVEPYPGTLDEYLYSCRIRREGGDSEAAAPALQQSDARRTRIDDKDRKRREAALRNKRYRVLGPIEKRVGDLEARISELEQAQAERSAQLSDAAVYADAGRRNELLNAFQKAAEKLTELTNRWEGAQEELEEASASLDRELAELDG